MYQRDYILRMVQMLAELIAGILGLIKSGKFEQASESLENAYFDFLKQDAAFFRSIPKEKLTDELLALHDFTNDHLEILSELFHAEAQLHHSQKHFPPSLEYFEKALILQEFIAKQSKAYSVDKQEKINALRLKIEEVKQSR